MGICNDDGECKIDTNSVICDGIFSFYYFKHLKKYDVKIFCTRKNTFIIRYTKSFSGLEEGEACGCDMTEKCLGECKPGLECIIEGLGHGTCTKKESE